MGGFDPYGPDPYSDAPVENYYFDDPSLYDHYDVDHHNTESIQATDYREDGTNSSDTINKSSSGYSWTLAGYSGNDNLTGGPSGDVMFGGLGADTLTGNGGSDQFYFTALNDGADTITDFGSGDSLLFNYAPASSYSRIGITVDANSSGGTYSIAASGNQLPNIWNFTRDLGSVANASGVVSTFSNFRVTTDGTNATSTSEDFFVVVGNASYTGVFVWRDNGNGVISTDELSHMANLTGVNNDSITGSEFAFQSISGV